MIKFENAELANFIVHQIGNSYIGETSKYSKYELDLREFEQVELMKLLIKPYKELKNSFRFDHVAGTKHNVLFNLSTNVFDNESFVDLSIDISKCLFSQSNHHSIKSGQLFVAKLKNLEYNDHVVDGLLISKIESGTKFIKPEEQNDYVTIQIDQGIVTRNIEKSCLIINKDYHEGYIVFNFEKNNSDTNYWSKNFLNIIEKDDDFNVTNNIISGYREYLNSDALYQNYSKKEKIELVNETINYLETCESEIKISTLLKDGINSGIDTNDFKFFLEEKFNEEFVSSNRQFSASHDAIKIQKKKFRSIIKLDKNFHIYIHGNERMIEQGIDSDGQKYYKFYYESEA